MTKVINIKKEHLRKLGYEDLEQWLQGSDHIYIGRAVRYVKGAKQSKWHNPFSRKKYGRQKCIQLYEEYIRNQPELLGALPELKGKTLGCWCKPKLCHGDILLKLIGEMQEG